MMDDTYKERGCLYRSRSGMVFGICKGIATYFDFSLFWIRVLTVIAFLASGIWPMLILYLFMALLLKPEPVVRFRDMEEKVFYDAYADTPRSAVHGLRARYERLDRRIRRVENAVTSKEFEWDRKFNSI